MAHSSLLDWPGLVPGPFFAWATLAYRVAMFGDPV